MFKPPVSATKLIISSSNRLVNRNCIFFHSFSHFLKVPLFLRFTSFIRCFISNCTNCVSFLSFTANCFVSYPSFSNFAYIASSITPLQYERLSIAESLLLFFGLFFQFSHMFLNLFLIPIP